MPFVGHTFDQLREQSSLSSLSLFSFSNQARYAFGVTGGVYDLSPVIPETCLPVDYLSSAMELQYVDSTKLCPTPVANVHTM